MGEGKKTRRHGETETRRKGNREMGRKREWNDGIVEYWKNKKTEQMGRWPFKAGIRRSGYQDGQKINANCKINNAKLAVFLNAN